MRRLMTVAAGITILLTASACGSSVEKDATYESVADLREAVLETELDCPGDQVIDVPDSEAEEISCTADVQLGVYPDPDDLAMVAFGTQVFSGDHVLKGPNWTITGPDEVALGKARDVLGGELQINSR